MYRLAMPDVSHAAQLSALMRRTFVEAYKGCTSPANMAAFLDAEYLPDLQRAELASDGVRTWVVEDSDGRWVGFAQLRLSRPLAGVGFAAPAQLARIYVESAHAGHGLGGRLLDEVISTAASAGRDGIWLSVWKHAPGPIAVYRRRGFEIVGETAFVMGDDRLEDWVMARPLG